MRINLRVIMATFSVMIAGMLSGCAGGDNGATIAAPVVILTSPANNATGVLLTEPIAVAFSKVMQSSAFTPTTFTVTSSGGSVSGGISYANGYATLTPSTPMLPGTLYTATVAAGVQATDGSALAASYSWSFTTGPLNAAFGVGGVVTTPVSLTRGDGARAVAVQADGKIVAVGYVVNGGGDYDFAIVRYNLDGSLDAGFGGDGIVTTAISARSEARAVAIQGDGKIVVAGVTSNTATGTDFVVARYNSTDGSLDGTFNTGGYIVTDLGASNNDEAFAVAIQSTGKIVVVGQTGTIIASDFALVRYTASGALDTTFDADGIQTTTFGEVDAAYSVTIQADDKIVVAGITDSTPGADINNDFALARYDANGALDATFDGDGKVTTAVGATDEGAFAIGIQTGGKIVVAGVVFNGANNDFGLARYNTNGSLDSTFGTGGIVITDMAGGNDAALALLIQADNKIVVGGVAFVTNQGNDFATARYNLDGSLDATFDVDGKVITNISAAHDTAYGVALSGNNIVLAGSSGADASANFVLVGFSP